MVSITKENFSIGQICESGQCFRLHRLEGSNREQKIKAEIRNKRSLTNEDGNQISDGKYALTALGQYLEMEQRQNQFFFDCTPEEFERVWREYFDLEEDYGKIMDMIDPRDTYLLKAAAYGSGIRILRQDLWEMIISFIVSQQNNIRRIRKCIETLCQRYGEEKRLEDGRKYYIFPTPETLAKASLEELYACNLGYRSKYIHKTAASVALGDIDLDAIRQMDYKEAMKELCKLTGVGEKVANCICLFALHKTEAFPVDTHIQKVLREQYADGFPFDRYAGYAGTLQQYIFYYDLKKGGIIC